jgi:hypothetical protein
LAGKAIRRAIGVAECPVKADIPGIDSVVPAAAQ